MFNWMLLASLLLVAALIAGCAAQQQRLEPQPAAADAAPDGADGGLAPSDGAVGQPPAQEESAAQPPAEEQPAGPAPDVSAAPAPAPPQVKEFRIEAFRFGFEPSRIEVDRGDAVRIIATSRDGTHGFALPQYRVNLVLTKGSEQVAEFVADTSGEFTFQCSVPCGSGHSAMKGTLIVR